MKQQKMVGSDLLCCSRYLIADDGGSNVAGIPLEKLAGSNTSVFAGCFSRDYHDIQMRDPESLPSSYLVSSSTTMFANRISHFYDLRGASMTIETGCSSSLVALYQACQSIRSGESDLSIVGASSIMLSQDMFIGMSTAR